jgi:hypothetical protein
MGWFGKKDSGGGSSGSDPDEMLRIVEERKAIRRSGYFSDGTPWSSTEQARRDNAEFIRKYPNGVPTDGGSG